MFRYYLKLGATRPAMLALWVVGQFAVYGPARRASLVSPPIATRAV